MDRKLSQTPSVDEQSERGRSESFSSPAGCFIIYATLRLSVISTQIFEFYKKAKDGFRRLLTIPPTSFVNPPHKKNSISKGSPFGFL